MSCPIVAVGDGAFVGDVRPSGLDIRWSVDRPSTRYWKPPGAAVGRPGVSRAGLRG
jgi:hypothetical protein